MTRTLPKFSLQRAENLLPQHKWRELISGLITELDGLLPSPEDEFKASSDSIKDFVDLYLAEAARGILAAANTGDSRKNIKAEDYALQIKVLELARRMSQSSVPLSEVTLLNLAVVCQDDTTRGIARGIIGHSLSSGTDVAAAFMSSAEPILSTPFGEGQDPSSFLTIRLNLIKILNALLRCGADLPSLVLGKALYRSLGYCYHTVLDAVAHTYSATGIRPNEVGPSFRWQIPWMEVKVGILDATHGLIEHAQQAAKAEEEARHKIFDILLAMIDDSPKKPQSSHTIWFGNVPLLVDYQHVHHLKERLSELAGLDETVVELVIPSLDGLINSHAPGDSDAVGALIILLREVSHTTAPPVAPPVIKVENVDKGKGKGKAVVEEEPEVDHELDLAVTQVLDIFPDENPSFVKAALQDPTMGRSPEALIAALLESNLPPHLASLRDGPPQQPTQSSQATSSQPPAQFERRNIFDDDEMDFSRLRIGGTKSGDADALINDRSFIEEMKADILRRAQEQQGESDDEGPARPMPRRDIAFEDELDDELAKPTFKLASVDGEESDEGDSGEGEDEDAPPEKKESPEDILARAYIRDPKLFERDPGTRRSKARADLKAETGMGDEQIEGWKIMLERNPRKDKILEKYDPAFNPASNRERPVQQTHDHHVHGGNDRGRGGRGRGQGQGQERGRGRGRGGGRGGPPQGDGPGSSRSDRARKEKSKTSMRQGGHDKKLTRGGGPS
ncbi:hypothetical protein M407DRAFT_18226 [Tulasnella calospora MUT 4182]|uniref:CUE domain-containing protein n=1 Tax=Tulasnella calospora MUT 4182 TaxID=1051891 RepID=A0A0C3QTZ5_9AGAM|nr:hypothetical protein M407DRAFT_18226 [Tulasnella calospora MUT 4182]